MRFYIFTLLIGISASAQQNNFVFPQGKLDVIVQEQEYDQVQGYPKETARTTYVYENQGGSRLHQILHTNVDSNGQESTIAKETMSYDEQNRIKMVAEEEINDNGVLYLSNEMFYTYNDKDQPIEIKKRTYDPDDGTFDIDRRYVFTYNNQGYLSQTQWYIGSAQTLIFTDEFTYDASNNLVQYLRKSSSGEDLERKVYEYNSAGKSTGFVWDKFRNNAWENYYKMEYVYDANSKNLLEETSYLYKDTAWKPNVKIQYTYDENKLYSNTYRYNDYSNYLGLYEWVDNLNAVAEIKYHSFDSHPRVNKWKYNKSVSFNYVDSGNLSTADIASATQNAKLSVYPNPAKDYFKILNNESVNKVTLIDASGRVVREYRGKQNEYSIQGLQKGVYIVLIKNGQSTKSTQIIIK